MRKFLCAATILVMLSCKEHQDYGKAVQEPSLIISDISSLLRYGQKHLKFYEPFTALDTSQHQLTKTEFLKFLSTGKYFPLKRISRDSTIYYQLQKFPAHTDEDLISTVQFWGEEELANFNLQGTRFPMQKFVDMDGNQYDSVSTKNKILVLKCWFVDCLPCVKEMPALNSIKQKFSADTNVVWLSLCWDPKPRVDSILKKIEFHYATAPDQYSFLVDTLHLSGYPTHFVLDKSGRIITKTSNVKELDYVVDQATQD